jgi:hypothetical protein
MQASEFSIPRPMSTSAAKRNGRKTTKVGDAFPRIAIRYAGEAVREAVREHKLLGNPVAIWREGKVMLLHPDGSLTEPEPRE